MPPMVSPFARGGEGLVTEAPLEEEGPHVALALDGHDATIGERGDHRNRAQELDKTYGKVIRIGRNGEIPKDNPFVGRSDANAAVWSYGHRNPQGLALNPFSGELFEHEHGPQGGDEINVIRKGANYGWPVITYGREYWGPKIGEGTAKAGMEQPIYYWDPVIAPGGLAYYNANLFPKWKGNVFAAGLNSNYVARLTVEGDKVKGEERLKFSDQNVRYRDINVGPDGAIYVLTDGPNAQLLKVVPKG